MRALILLPLILAACGQAPEAATENAVANTSVASDPQRRLAELPAESRNGVFLRAIRDGDAPCQGVTGADRQPDQNGNPVFVARCSDGPVYAIAVDRNGVAQVTRVSPDRR